MISVVPEDDDMKMASEWTSKMRGKKDQRRVIYKGIIDSKFFDLRDKTYIFGTASKSKVMHVIKQCYICM